MSNSFVLYYKDICGVFSHLTIRDAVCKFIDINKQDMHVLKGFSLYRTDCLIFTVAPTGRIHFTSSRADSVQSEDVEITGQDLIENDNSVKSIIAKYQDKLEIFVVFHRTLEVLSTNTGRDFVKAFRSYLHRFFKYEPKIGAELTTNAFIFGTRLGEKVAYRSYIPPKNQIPSSWRVLTEKDIAHIVSVFPMATNDSFSIEKALAGAKVVTVSGAPVEILAVTYGVHVDEQVIFKVPKHGRVEKCSRKGTVNGETVLLLEGGVYKEKWAILIKEGTNNYKVGSVYDSYEEANINVGLHTVIRLEWFE